jgi:subtilisin-like proprotein convertase family protein
MNTRVCVSMTIALAALTTVASAAYPPPSNDTPGSAEVIASLPAVVTGSNVAGDDTISATSLSGLGSVPGADVFYSFTPSASGNHWIAMIPWIQVPVYASSGSNVPLPNLCLYVREAGSGTFIAGANATVRGQPETVVANLTAGVTYEIVVDSTEVDQRGQEFEFTLVVDTAPTAVAEDCFSPGFVPGTLPTVILGSVSSAADDFLFQAGTGRCAPGNSSGITLPVADNVFEFTTGADPNSAGDYAITFVALGIPWNGFVYVTDSCPPFFPLGCLGVGSHTSSTVRQSETIVVTLDFDTTYSLIIDAATFVLPDAKYAVFVSRAEDWNFTELEDNDVTGLATPLSSVLDGGQLTGPSDVDYWSISAVAGDKLYALVDNGNAPLSGIDTNLTIIQPDGVTPLEYDGDDGEGGQSPVATLVYRTSSFAGGVAGTPLLAGGTYYLEVTSGPTGTISRYYLHHGLVPSGRVPTPECEPNPDASLADGSAREYYSGAITEMGDVDSFTFTATAGQQIFIALDGDPERDSGGFDEDSAFALDGALSVLDPDGDVLISDHDDINAIVTGEEPDYPAELLTFVAPVSGTYTVQVTGGDPATDFGAGRTYELAIFKDELAPVLAEELPPAIDSIVPNFGADLIDVTASDDAVGDSGLCGVSLAPGSVNLMIQSLSLTPGDPTVTFEIALVNPSVSGSGKVIVTDCAGNTACAAVEIDATLPQCTGGVFTSGVRTYSDADTPLWVPDNDIKGILANIDVNEIGTIADINVTLSIESAGVTDAEVVLVDPNGLAVTLLDDQGSSSDYSIFDATFDDAAEEPLSFFDDEPYTGSFKPLDPNGLANFNGRDVNGTWILFVRDDNSSPSGGFRLKRWSLTIDAGFPNAESFAGMADDAGGLASVELIDPNNAVLTVDPFTPGDTSVSYTLELINPAFDGSGTILVTDTSANTCSSVITLSGLPDTDDPVSSGAVTRDLVIGTEPQVAPPTAANDPNGEGVVSSVVVTDSFLVGEVEASLFINTRDIGRVASTLSKDGATAVLINRVGMDERGSVGRTKDNIDVILDDDAPVADDAHLEPALGSDPFRGLHQPDGRGDYIGDAVDSDPRDNMLFVFEGMMSDGVWDLFVSDNRLQGSAGVRHEIREWTTTLKSPGGPERYVGTASDAIPGAGLCSIALAAGATNLQIDADFEVFGAAGTYVVSLIDPNQDGVGAVEIADCAGNVTVVPITLEHQTADQILPAVSGAVDPNTAIFNGQAFDAGGIADVSLAPFGTNLQVLSVTPPLPSGFPDATFEVGLVDPNFNGRGYVRVTDKTGWRRHLLVEIDASAPVCTGSYGQTKRYVSTDTPIALPDANTFGILSTIVVPDADRISDLNLTFNITHPFADDIDMFFSTPLSFGLFSDIGLTGNDFIDTTLDDEADFPIPDSSSAAPWTGSYQPETPGVLAAFDNSPAAGTYSLRVADDATFNIGTLDSWSLTIESATFPMRYDGRAADNASLDNGICSIVLAPGASGLTLEVDPYNAGAGIVRYGVSMTSPMIDGIGSVVVSDCAGNTCETEICMIALPPEALYGDIASDGVVDGNDWPSAFELCISGPTPVVIGDCDPCIRADFTQDTFVDMLDIAEMQIAVSSN